MIYFHFNKFCAYLLNFEPRNLVFLKTYNTVFDDTAIKFTDQHDKPLEIQDKVHLTFLIKLQNK